MVFLNKNKQSLAYPSSPLSLSITIRVIFFAILLPLALFIDNARTNEPLKELAKIGITPLNQAPINFNLQDLSGKEHQLKDYQGKWIWLVFWATWCGPCQYELPTLESLFQEFKNDNFTVLGVSVDQGEQSAVRRFLKK